MAEVATKGSKITSSTAPNHINIKKSNPPTPAQCVAGWHNGVWESGYWVGSECYGELIPPQPQPDSTDRVSATVTGTVEDGATNVFINGKPATFKGAKTTENDTYNLPSGWTYVSGQHTNASGSVTGGSSTVFVNGKGIARKGDAVTTHAGNSTTIQDGASNVFAN